MRRARAKGYCQKFTVLDTLGGEILGHLHHTDTPLDGVRGQVLGIWQVVVSMDMRWETHASFAVMLTRILVNASATEATEPVVLWLLKGEPLVSDGAGSGEPAAAAAPFPGLLGMLAHGDPSAAGESAVQNLKLSLSMWAAKVFSNDVKAHGQFISR